MLAFDMLPGRVLKGGADVPAKPVADISSLSISLNKFPGALKLGKIKQAFQKRPKNRCLKLHTYCLHCVNVSVFGIFLVRIFPHSD